MSRPRVSRRYRTRPLRVEVVRSGGARILRREVEKRAPLACHLPQHLARAVGCDLQRQDSPVGLIGQKACQPRVLLEKLECTAGEVDAEQIEESRIAPIQQQWQLTAAPSAQQANARPHTGERRQIARLTAQRIHRKQVIILCPTDVLQVDEASGIGPAVDADTSSSILRYGHCIALSIEGRHKDVKHAVQWREP